MSEQSVKKTFIERLSRIRGGKSRTAFAKEVGVSEGAMRNYEGGTIPALDIAARIVKAGDVSLDWLIGNVDDHQSSTDVRSIPRFDIGASAGNGSVVLSETPDGHLQIDEGIVLPYASKKAQLGVIDIVGDSMWPTLIDGDLVIVDFNHDRRQLAGGGIFVFTKGQDLFVKRMILSPDGILSASSDNAEYPTITFDTSQESDDIIIHGKVIWVGGTPRPVIQHGKNGG